MRMLLLSLDPTFRSMTVMRVIRSRLRMACCSLEAIGSDEGAWTFSLLDESIQYVLVRVELTPMVS